MQALGTSTLRCGVLLIALAAAGCGQKGPLYHPDATPPASAPASTPAAAPATKPTPAPAPAR
jgi:predicted small lipoprotein YifL